MTNSSAGRISMRKPATKAAAPTAPGSTTPPLTVNVITALLGVMVLCNVVSALLSLGSTAALKRFVIANNLKAKSPQDPYDAVHAVYQLRQSAIIQGLLFLVMLSLLAWALRRPRSASATRWALLIIFIVTGLPYQIVPSSGLPVPMQVTNTIDGLAAVAVVLLIFAPLQSRAYFRACREASMPEGQRGQPRPGFGSLFGPRRPAPGAGAAGARGAARTGRTATQPAQTRPADTRPSAGKARSKVRSDSDAVAKGADLARSRAKASKSRRTN